MQVWNSAAEEFTSQNKQTGRKIKTADFNDVLGSFISDGDRLLVHHIPNILRKLWRLASILHKLPGFRFYGCSLLFIYDGDADTQDQLRIATEDNLPIPSGPAPTKMAGGLGASLSAAPSAKGDMGGSSPTTDTLPSLPSTRPNQRQHHHHHHQEVPEPTRHRRDSETFPERRSRSADADDLRGADGPSASTTGRRAHPRHGHHPSASASNVNNPSTGANATVITNPRGIGGEVKIRIVDFAHTTTGKDFVPLDPALDDTPESLGKGYDAPVDVATGKPLARFPPVHADKPDEGFIFGIRKLCDAFVVIWDTERLRRRKALAAGLGGPGAEQVQLPRLELAEGEKVWRRVMDGKGWEDGYLST